MKMTGIKVEAGKKYIIDSCGWIEYFSEGNNVDDYAEFIENANPDQFLSPSIIIYEVYKKIRNVYSEESALKAIAHIRFVTNTLELTDELAMSAADTSILNKLPMADAIIAATSQKHGAVVVTSDRHFREMENVIFIEK